MKRLGKLFFQLTVLPLLFATVSLAPAQGSERTVGNGGGLAEMKAIFLRRNLATYLYPCVNQPALCGASSAEAAELARAIEVMKASRPETLLIDHELGTSRVFATERRPGSVIRVSPYALYEPRGLPRSTAQISGILLAAFWSQVSSRTTDDLLARALRVTGSIAEESASFKVSERPAAVIHQLSIQYANTSSIVVFVEDTLRTMNLTDKLAEVVPALSACPGSGKGELSLENWRNVGRETRGNRTSISLLADASTECSGNRSYRVLALRFELDADGAIDETSVTARAMESL